MLCPKCRNNVTGKWCVYCGAKLDEVPPASYPGSQQGNSQNSLAAGRAGEGNTEDLYRDDVYSTNDYSRGEGYYSPEDSVNPYNDYYDHPSGNKGKIIAIVSICTVVLIIVGFLLFNFVFSKDDSKTDDSNKKADTTQSDADNKVKTLTKKGESLMSSGNYEEAEEVYLELSELTKDDKTTTIYDILYNYNRAVKRLNSGDFEAAEKFYNNIPLEYVDYDISSDIDNLKDNIRDAKNASKQLEQLREYIDEENIDAAKEIITIIDDTYLSPSEKLELENLTDKLTELEELKMKEAEEEKKKQEEEERKRLEEEAMSGYGDLSEYEAENILYNYCYYLVSAINANNFSIVAPYIHPSSKLYSQQKALVDSCNSQGITESLEELTVNYVTKINNSKWEAKVTEREMIYYADGSQKDKTFNWIYTIEYINNQFYVTGLR